jgi:3-oxoacyl-[acyl-carrier protein] reductase
MANRVRDRVAVVTGAGRGIGDACALRLAEEGARVTVAELNPEWAKQTVTKIVAAGGDALACPLDVRNRAAVERCMKDTRERFGRLDILINNAGFSKPALLGKMTEEQWDLVIDVSLKGQFNCAQFAAPYMIEGHWGRIVNISSLSYMGNVGNANYSSAKSGVLGLTRALAKELGRHGIVVNAIAPGAIDTPGLAERLPAQYRDQFVKATPLRRIGTARDVANVALFLASDEAKFITANVVHVSGGIFD